MDGWLGILVFGALFFLMMRFGCGAHMMRGHGKEAGGAHAGHGGCGVGHDASAGAQSSPVKSLPSQDSERDPVCGMTVVAGQGYRKFHNGTSYSFCSKECLERFEAEPDRYSATQQAPSQVHA
jgi:YHS domain-containing protein